MEYAERYGYPPMERAPSQIVGPLAWMRENLLGSWLNRLLTALSLGFIYLVGRVTLVWAFGQADWRVIVRNFRVILWGRYPVDHTWRLGLSLALLALLTIWTVVAWRRANGERGRAPVVLAWLVSPLVLALILRGFTLPTPATVANNLGYYLFRPELLPRLEEMGRPATALIVAGLLSGLTWGMVRGRRARALSAAASLALLAFLLPVGITVSVSVLGIRVPSLLSFLLTMAASYYLGHRVGLRLINLAGSRRFLAIAWIVGIPAILLILTFFDVGVPRVAPAPVLRIVEPAIWGGILLTLVLSAVSIVASFPIGVLLALGRRSRLPVVKVFCTLMIELVRGVPLITILFMAQVMLPLFLPLGVTIDRVLRAMAGMTLFTGAYLAEVVRGGLQAVRREQYEAARALGLSEVLVTGVVVLPQALRAVIPAIMGQFVSIFKDTSLVAIVGLLDLLGVSQSIIKQRDFIGAVREVYVFAAVFYFLISYGMSYASRRIERRLGVGEH